MTIPNTWGLAGYCTCGGFGEPGAVSRAHHAAVWVAGRRKDAEAGALGGAEPDVPFDAYAWLLTDPQTSVGSSPLADVPCLPELPRLIRLKYLTEVNRWTICGPRLRCWLR